MDKGKKAQKKKIQTQVNREAKADMIKAQREQMIEVLRETKAVNFELADQVDDCDSQEGKVPVNTSSQTLIKPPEAVSDDICCQETK